MAHWIINNQGIRDCWCTCSACGNSYNDIYMDVLTKIACPDCGSIMDRYEDEYVEEKKISVFNSVIKSIEHLRPSIILDAILKDSCIRNYNYVILGQPGPTGKTWLYNQLKNRRYEVSEISEHICNLVHYEDCVNHCITDEFKQTITIILNEPLKEVKDE